MAVRQSAPNRGTDRKHLWGAIRSQTKIPPTQGSKKSCLLKCLLFYGKILSKFALIIMIYLFSQKKCIARFEEHDLPRQKGTRAEDTS